jgi:hypothetical protein
METWGGTLGMALIVGLAVQASTTTTYDPAAHRWWRIREEAGTIYFETSPDAAQWNTLLQTGSPPQLETVYVVLAAQVGAAYGAPVRAEFDNLNLLP